MKLRTAFVFAAGFGAFLALASTASHAILYKWIDENGRVVYGDQPPPGAKPETVFAYKKIYTLNVNMPNLNSATGSWILNFSELHSDSESRHHAQQTMELSGPVPVQKVDPQYPQTFKNERVAGEVVLYAVIRRDGSVDSIQLVRGIDQQLDANAIRALRQWKFRPGAKQGAPVELEAIVHIPFRLPEYP